MQQPSHDFRKEKYFPCVLNNAFIFLVLQEGETRMLQSGNAARRNQSNNQTRRVSCVIVGKAILLGSLQTKA